MIDLDITELFEEIVKELPEGLEILYPNGKGGTKVVKSPRLITSSVAVNISKIF